MLASILGVAAFLLALSGARALLEWRLWRGRWRPAFIHVVSSIQSPLDGQACGLCRWRIERRRLDVGIDDSTGDESTGTLIAVDEQLEPAGTERDPGELAALRSAHTSPPSAAAKDAAGRPVSGLSRTDEFGVTHPVALEQVWLLPSHGGAWTSRLDGLLPTARALAESAFGSAPRATAFHLEQALLVDGQRVWCKAARGRRPALTDAPPGTWAAGCARKALFSLALSAFLALGAVVSFP